MTLNSYSFSLMTLVWLLKDFPVGLLAQRLHIPPEDEEELVRFRDELLDRLLVVSLPRAD
jgi:hypothetical protein